jgi:hypothetical protein
VKKKSKLSNVLSFERGSREVIVKFTCLVLTFTLVVSAAALIVWSDVRAAEMSDEARAQVFQMMRELNDGKEVECEPMMRLLLGIGEDEEFDPKNIAHLLGIEKTEEVDCDGLVRELLGIEAGEEIDNRQLLKLLLGIRDDSEITDEQILQMLESAYSKTKAPV